jgi:hypothetical protein
MFPAMHASDPIRQRRPSHGRTSSVTFSMRQCARPPAGEDGALCVSRTRGGRGMITVDTIGSVRRAYFVQRAISRVCNVSFVSVGRRTQ